MSDLTVFAQRRQTGAEIAAQLPFLHTLPWAAGIWRSNLYQSSAAQTRAMVANRQYSRPIYVPNTCTLTGLSINVTSAGDLGRQVTDAVLNSTTTLTSATAAFVATDVGRKVTGTGIPADTYIATRVSATEITMTKAATASASGVTVDISGVVIRQGILADDGSGHPGALALDALTVSGAAIATPVATISKQLTAGLYHLTCVAQGVTTTAPTVTAGGSLDLIEAQTAVVSLNGGTSGYFVSGVAGALPDPFGYTFGNSSSTVPVQAVLVGSVP